MEAELLKQWEKNHSEIPNAGTPAALWDGWRRCVASGVDPYTPLTCSGCAESDTHPGPVALYLLTGQVFRTLGRRCTEGRVGLALFNSQGVLMELYGAEEFYLWAETQQILAGTVWSEEHLGANAVASGLRENRSLASAGPENYSISLLETAVYFSPVSGSDGDGCLGGIAVLVPYEDHHGALLGLSASIAINLEQEIGRSIHAGHDEGLLVVNTLTADGTPKILQYNDMLARMFGILPDTLRGRAIWDVFDPSPKNSEFWDVLTAGKLIHDKELSLSVRGIRQNVLITAEPYTRLSLNQQGMCFFLHRPAPIAKAVTADGGMSSYRAVFDQLIGKSECYQAAIQQLKLCAESDANVLLQGESGTGKDVFAQAIHNASDRRKGPFVAVNCAAFPRELIFSELFGYEGGAFTGSKRQGNVGKFELADSGTLFLDEIGDMPLELQAILLRVIEEKSIMRIGSNRMIKINVKIVSATNADLLSLIQKKLFRLDLYYRLSALQVRLPPLRDRGEDIILLAEHFIQSARNQLRRPRDILLSEEAKVYLMQLPWCGNIRELKNIIEGVVNLYPVQVITADHIRDYISRLNSGFINISKSVKTAAPPLRKPRELTANQLKDALISTRYNKSAAANYLGISRRTLYRKLNELEALSSISRAT